MIAKGARNSAQREPPAAPERLGAGPSVGVLSVRRLCFAGPSWWVSTIHQSDIFGLLLLYSPSFWVLTMSFHSLVWVNASGEITLRGSVVGMTVAVARRRYKGVTQKQRRWPAVEGEEKNMGLQIIGGQHLGGSEAWRTAWSHRALQGGNSCSKLGRRQQELKFIKWSGEKASLNSLRLLKINSLNTSYIQRSLPLRDNSCSIPS